MRNWFLPWLMPLIFVSVWAIVFSQAFISPLLLPDPRRVGQATRWLFAPSHESFIGWDFLATFWRLLLGYGLGILIGLPIGIWTGCSKIAQGILGASVDFLRSLPVSALFPLFILFFGLGHASKIAPVVYLTTLLMIINSEYGIRQARPIRLLASRALHLSPSRLFFRVLLPEALPYISVGMRLALSLSLILIIVSEMIIGTELGLGKRILEAQLVYRTDEMYAIIFLTGLFGYGINKGYALLEKRYIHWMGH